MSKRVHSCRDSRTPIWQVFEKSANSCLQIQRSELEAFDLGRRKFDKFSVIPNVQVINHSISIIRDSREHTRKMKREEEKREEEDIFSQDIRRIRGVIYIAIGNLSSLCDHMCALLNFSTSCSYPDHPNNYKIVAQVISNLNSLKPPQFSTAREFLSYSLFWSLDSGTARRIDGVLQSATATIATHVAVALNPLFDCAVTTSSVCAKSRALKCVSARMTVAQD
ncbi:hypothetical protein ADUPG1_009455, partial [Aduncisulcus paluster]